MTLTNEGEPLASDQSGDVCEPMTEVRPGAPAGTALARARVLGALFGPEATVGAFGRFRVVARLGAGGMGVVYEAYDPDLARGVALKLVGVTDKDREAALAEAKALARLSHPNVVPIYDYGLHGDHVYLVMELVRGETLQRWSTGRTLRDIVAVYLQAGAALAAAHDVGLVHRDFKPDNAIVGADGRVRVVDFGLACKADGPERATSERRRAAGTPRFMAPEIREGAAVTPAADQYSFCVALAEAMQLAGESPSRRIAGVVERGRALDPADRYPSMRDLMRALARDPARTWRRVFALAGLAVVVGVASFLAGKLAPDDEWSCDDGEAKMEAVWSTAERASGMDRVAAFGPRGTSLRRLLEDGITTHVRHWVREYQQACVDRHHKSESAVMSYHRDTCLRRRADELAVVGEQFIRAEPATLSELPQAVQRMNDPVQCSDKKALESEIEPPPPALAPSVTRVQFQITRAAMQVGIGHYEEAFANARDAVSSARSLGYLPTLAEALLVQGQAAVALDRSKAVPILAEAVAIALSARADALAIEAWARRAYAQGTSTDPEGAVSGLDVIAPLAERTAAATFARPLLFNNLGNVELARGHRALARDYFQRALAESKKIRGTVPLELAAIRLNLVLVSDDRQLADRILAEETQALSVRLGKDHPYVLEQRMNFLFGRGFATIEHLHDAAELLTPECGELEQLTTLTGRVAECWTEVGLLRWDLGDHPGASDAMTQAVRVKPDAEMAVPYLSLFQGRAQAAAQQFDAALAANQPKPDEPWWDRLSRACLHLGLGRARRATGDLHGARAALGAAIDALERIVREHPAADYERRLGRARVELAFTLSALHASPAEIAKVAIPAVSWLEGVGGDSEEIRRLTTAPKSSAR